MKYRDDILSHFNILPIFVSLSFGKCLCLCLCLANKPKALPDRHVAVAVPSGLALQICPR